MARITVEDCLNKVDNRFALIHLAAKRVRQLRKGSEPLVICKNKDSVTALREIAAGRVMQMKSTLEASLPDSGDIPFFMPLSNEEAEGGNEREAADMNFQDKNTEQESDSNAATGSGSTKEEDPAQGEGK